ncbi:16841_t:CDS:2, partial [Funneliformis geosporum]
CEMEQIDQKLDCYVKSLENIVNSGAGCRREKAQTLLDNYRKASIDSFVIKVVLLRQQRPSRSYCYEAQIEVKIWLRGNGFLVRSTDGFDVQKLLGMDTRLDYHIARAWESGRSHDHINYHQPTFIDGGTINAINNGAISGGTFITESSKKSDQEKDDHKEQTNTKRTKIEHFFTRDITPSQFKENVYIDHVGEESVSSPPQDVQDNYTKDPEYFDKLVDNVDLSYIGGEEEPAPPPPKSGNSEGKTWDTFMIDGIDLILDGKWSILNNPNMIFLIIWSAHLMILKSYIEHLKLPINEGELMICFVAPAFRMSLDPNQEKFQKHWSEQQLVASQERRRQEQDPNDERARAGQKTDIIIVLPTGPALEGFICEVSGGLPAGCPKKIWTDKLKLMVGMRDMINRVMKTFPGLSTTDYMKVVVFGCQVIGLQMNLYAMDVRTSGIYRFGMIDKVSLPASSKELPAYEAVHTMLRSLEHRLNKLTDYCTDLKIKHAKLRRRRDYIYQEDNLAFSNNSPNTSPQRRNQILIYSNFFTLHMHNQ